MPTSRRGAGVGFALITGLIALFAFAPSAWAVEPGGPSGDGIQPYVVEDANGDPVTNPDCEDALGPGYFQLKDDNPGAGNKTLADSYMSVALVYGTFPIGDSHEGESYVNFTATKGVDAVIVKGGQPGDAFVYTPESKDDTLLHPPINPNNGKYFGISHVDVCYDIELEVSKTATTSFTRDHDWKVSKTNDTTGTVNVAPGEPYKVNYEVTAETNGYADSGFAVSGNITVKNPHPTASREQRAGNRRALRRNGCEDRGRRGDVPEDDARPGRNDDLQLYRLADERDERHQQGHGHYDHGRDRLGVGNGRIHVRRTDDRRGRLRAGIR